jgi:hypothetical protein
MPKLIVLILSDIGMSHFFPESRKFFVDLYSQSGHSKDYDILSTFAIGAQEFIGANRRGSGDCAAP